MYIFYIFELRLREARPGNSLSLSLYISISKFAQPLTGVRSRKSKPRSLLDCTENTVLSNKMVDFTVLAAPEHLCARFRCSSSLGATKGRSKTLLGLPRSRRLRSKTLLELARNRLCARLRCSSSLGAIKMRTKTLLGLPRSRQLRSKALLWLPEPPIALEKLLS